MKQLLLSVLFVTLTTGHQALAETANACAYRVAKIEFAKVEAPKSLTEAIAIAESVYPTVITACENASTTPNAVYHSALHNSLSQAAEEVFNFKALIAATPPEDLIRRLTFVSLRRGDPEFKDMITPESLQGLSVREEQVKQIALEGEIVSWKDWSKLRIGATLFPPSKEGVASFYSWYGYEATNLRGSGNAQATPVGFRDLIEIQ